MKLQPNQKLIPTHNNVYMRVVTPATQSGIVIPQTASPVNHPYGLILGVGPEVTCCKVGDKVLFIPNNGLLIGVEEGVEPTVIAQDKTIIGVITEAPNGKN